MISKIYSSSTSSNFKQNLQLPFGRAIEWTNIPSQGFVHSTLYIESEIQLLSFLNSLVKNGKCEFLPNNKLFSFKKIFKTDPPYNGLLLLKTFANPYKLEYLTHDRTIYSFIKEEKEPLAASYKSLIANLQKISRQNRKNFFLFNLFRKQ